MKLLDSLRFRIATFFRRSQMNAEMEEELRSHVQHRADDLERSGVSRAEAERRARVEFGGHARFKEECHETFAGHFFETLLRDIRFGLRILRKSPGFTAVAVLTLAMAIGANAVVFSVINGLILRPINVPQARSLYTIEIGKDRSPQQSYPDYLDLRDRSRSFDGIVAYSIDRAALDAGSGATSSWIYQASGNYFDVLKINPYLGRFFHLSDEHGPNSSPYLVLSFAYWSSHFQSDPAVIGRTVLFNKFPYTILGVAPPEFRGTELFFNPDFWVPLVDQEQTEGASNLNSRLERSLWMLGRVKEGVTPAQVTADLNSVAAYLSNTYPKEDDKISFALARPGLIGDMLGGPVRAFLAVLMLLAGCILIAACANLGSLFAARAADRAKEIALRIALGSGRKRVVHQLLTEAVLLSLLGGAFGLFFGVALLRWLSVWQPVANYPIHVPVNPDANSYFVALLLALASGLLFGLVPVRRVLRTDPYQVIKSGFTNEVVRRLTARDLLLVVQVAVCAVLVTSSLVAVRGLGRSLHSNFGFLPQSVMLVDTDLDMAGYHGSPVAVMQRRMLEAVQTIPGVTSAGLADRPQLAMNWITSPIFTDSTTDLRPTNMFAEPIVQYLAPGYFQAAGTTLIAGRDFTWHDDSSAPHVAVVNAEFARKLFSSVPAALGGYFKMPDGARIQVVGVTEDGKYQTISEEAKLAFFLPILQSPTSSTVLIIRSNRDPQQLAAALRNCLLNLDPALPLVIKPWNAELDSALFPSRVAAVSLGVLGALSIMLALTGISGMASYSVSKRLREFGIRVALGAQRKELLQAAVGRALRLLAFGSVAGLLLGVAGTKILSFVVYQATPFDPLVLTGVILAMLLLGLLATWIPARRALHADPLPLLREE